MNTWLQKNVTGFYLIFVVLFSLVYCSSNLNLQNHRKSEIIKRTGDLVDNDVEEVRVVKTRPNTTKIIKSLDKKTIYDFKAKMDQCTQVTCIMEYGRCIDKKICLCNDGYAEVPMFNNQKPQSLKCSYMMKKSIFAFTLEMLIPIGIGHLYAANYGLFLLKFSLMVLLPLIFMLVKTVKQGTISKSFDDAFSFIWFTGAGLVYLVDVIFYAKGKYTDGNGIPLQSFSY